MYYISVLINSYKSQCIYYTQIYSKIIFCILSYLIQMYIWKSIGSASNTAIINIQYMDQYVLLSTLIGMFMAFDMSYITIIDDLIHSGNIESEVSKPKSFLLSLFFDYLGKAAFKLFFSIFPLMLIISIINHSIILKHINIIEFLPALLMSVIIFYLISVICGMLAFWFVSVGPLHIIIDSCITLFSGAIIPLWFISEKYIFIYDFLPFKYLLYYPITIGLGIQSQHDCLRIYSCQFLWIIILFGIAIFEYHFGRKRLENTGG